MRKTWTAAAALAAALLLALFGLVGPAGSTATASGGSFEAELNGFQETPAVSTTGHGEFEAEVDDDRIEFELSFSGLEGTNTLAAHIHFGQKGVAGGVSAFLCGGGGKPACPSRSGTVMGTITPADIIGPAGQGIAAGEFAEVVRAMEAGKTYANVHTDKHPGGEIRGQIED